jgi:hypothetical protein
VLYCEFLCIGIRVELLHLSLVRAVPYFLDKLCNVYHCNSATENPAASWPRPPLQVLALYQGDVCLGSATILAPGPSLSSELRAEEK